MPASPDLADGLARATVQTYQLIERQLLDLIARTLARGLDSPEWAAAKLGQVRRVLAGAERIVDDLESVAAAQIRTAIGEAWARGGAAAVAELRNLGRPVGRLLDNARAVDAIVAETVRVVRATHRGILRAVEDTYRSVVAEVAPLVSAGVDTRRRAAQRALDRFADRGVTGFQDRAGRNWDLPSYAEMAVRTATGRAAVQAHGERLQASGIDLVWVTDVPQECILCRPWEGTVLALHGPVAGAVSARNVLTGQPELVAVAGTVEQARLAGLQHPNCRHNVQAYLPGATKLPEDTADPQGDADRRRLRELERHVRRWKRREAAALDDDARAAAGAKVRAWQAAIRVHVASTSAKRQPQRERIGTAR